MIDLTNIIGRREDIHLEAKSSKGGFPDSFWETYSAFANSDGGTILLGIEENDDHTLYVGDGLTDAPKMKDTFWNLVNNRQKISHNIVTNSMVNITLIEGKEILVVEVPRAERTARPVYKGLDPRNGTYRRWNAGDHLCSLEEVGAMLRDATLSSQDAKVLKGMNMTVFCKDTIQAYRQNFKTSNYGHLWNSYEDEMFLRRIGAMGVADDGEYYPTAAGLLMFGYEYEIVREFPQYFLDYQEDRALIGSARWKDRVVSSSGEWSGNLYDFILKILPKLQADLKTPFVLNGNQRIDDTPLHKLLREATVNALSHADFYGRQGVVITKDKAGFTFANPGRLRISKQEAMEGGISDPRNNTILKMFSLIRFGERAGSGLSGILHLWQNVFHTNATIREKDGEVDRTILTLPFDGNEPDVDAMLKLYDGGATQAYTGKSFLSPTNIADKLSINKNIADKLSINDKTIDKLAEIIEFLATVGSAKTVDIATTIGKSPSRVKEYLKYLVQIDLITPQGGNKNRTYSLKK